MNIMEKTDSSFIRCNITGIANVLFDVKSESNSPCSKEEMTSVILLDSQFSGQDLYLREWRTKS